MPLFSKFSTFRIEKRSEYDELCSRLDHQIAVLISEKSVFLTKIAVLEALHNAIEHGKFPIDIEFFNDFETDELLIKVKDSGKGFLVEEKIELIKKKGPDQLLKEMLYSERGRGIYMMHKVVSSVSFNEKGNEVSLVISN